MKGFGRLPDPIANAPDLWPWLHPYYAAFEELSSDRDIDYFTGNVGFIPWSSIDSYCRRNRHMDYDFSLTLYYIRVLDAAYRKWIREHKPKGGDKGGKPGSDPPERTPRKKG